MTWMGEIKPNPVKIPPEDEPQDEQAVGENNWTPEKDESIPQAEQEAVTQPLDVAASRQVAHDEEVSVPAPVAIAESPQGEAAAGLKAEDVEALKARWNAIQIEFVDEPRRSVEQADALVVDTLKLIEQAFSETRTNLESRWLTNEEVSTEDLRKTLQSYRSFFNRFLAY